MFMYVAGECAIRRYICDPLTALFDITYEYVISKICNMYVGGKLFKYISFLIYRDISRFI